MKVKVDIIILFYKRFIRNRKKNIILYVKFYYLFKWKSV